MTDDELLKALRDTARAEHADFATLPVSVSTNDAALLDRLTEVAMRELVASDANMADVARTKGAQVLSMPSKRLHRSTWVLPVAAAAAVLFAVLREPSPAPISTYRVELSLGAERTTRGVDAHTDSLALRAGAPFELALRPASKTPGPIAARVYVAQGASLRAVPVRVEVSALGMVRVYGNLPETLDTRSSRNFLLGVVGRPTALPEPSTLLTRDEMQADPAFQLFRIEIRAAKP